MANGPMQEIGEGDMKKRLEGLPGVADVGLEQDNPDGHFWVHMQDGSEFLVAKETLRAAWQMDDETLGAQLQKNTPPGES